ncbi:MAG TPA: hypothetical protein VFU73_02890 [Actinocrinis sp.]|nr:hypothetical protein [Actinocrinis sp.]
MNIRSKQVIAGVLALTAAYVGFWAQFAPASFFSSFPVAGHHWLAGLGPYNEHLVRDVGGLYLALFVVSGWAAVRPRTQTLRLAGVAWLAFSVPHLVFHLSHLDMYDTADKVGNIVSLGGTLVLAALLLLPTARGSADPAREATR